MNRREPRRLEGDRGRRYEIEVDGTVRGDIGRREELVLDIPPGDHLFRARIDWNGSPQLQARVSDDQELRLLVEPRVNLVTAAGAFFSRTRWLTLRLDDGICSPVTSSAPGWEARVGRFATGFGLLFLALNVLLGTLVLLDVAPRRTMTVPAVVGLVVGLCTLLMGRWVARATNQQH